MQAVRVAFGILLATLATPVAVAAMFAGGWCLKADGFAGLPWPAVQDRIVAYAKLSAPVALFMTTAFGVPYVHRLAELGRATALRTTLTGAVTGALPFLLFDGYVIGMNMLLLASEPYTEDSLVNVARWAGMGAWCGSWSALTYWLVAINRRRR